MWALRLVSVSRLQYFHFSLMPKPIIYFHYIIFREIGWSHVTLKQNIKGEGLCKRETIALNMAAEDTHTHTSNPSHCREGWFWEGWLGSTKILAPHVSRGSTTAVPILYNYSQLPAVLVHWPLCYTVMTCIMPLWCQTSCHCATLWCQASCHCYTEPLSYTVLHCATLSHWASWIRPSWLTV